MLLGQGGEARRTQRRGLESGVEGFVPQAHGPQRLGIVELCGKKERRTGQQQSARHEEDDLAVQGEFTPAPLFDHLHDDGETQSTQDDENHESDQDEGVGLEIDHRIAVSKQIEAGVAESGDCVEYRHPDALAHPIEGDHAEGENDRPRGLDGEGEQNHPLDQADQGPAGRTR